METSFSCFPSVSFFPIVKRCSGPLVLIFFQTVFAKFTHGKQFFVKPIFAVFFLIVKSSVSQLFWHFSKLCLPGLFLVMCDGWSLSSFSSFRHYFNSNLLEIQRNETKRKWRTTTSPRLYRLALYRHASSPCNGASSRPRWQPKVKVCGLPRSFLSMQVVCTCLWFSKLPHISSCFEIL